MPIYRVTDTSLEPVAETTFASERLLERRDLQRLLRADISPLGEDIMVIAEEFAEWDASQRRIDLLCLDRDASLVVVELKRTEDGGHMELQAIRYAAMVSSMTLERAVATYARTLGGDDAEARAQREILEFLDLPSVDEGALSDKVRMILVAADFSAELTTSVMWLNKQELDITCIRLKPYRLDGQVLLDVSQIIPLPEAADYVVRVREREQEKRKVVNGRQQILRQFWGQLIDRSKPKTNLLANRSATTDHWLSAGIGRSGFGLNLSLAQDFGRVECYVRLPGDDGERSDRAFEQLVAQKEAIEGKFGAPLEWQSLPNRIGSRICFEFPGGWTLPEEQWPDYQDILIDAMVRLANALRDPVQRLNV